MARTALTAQRIPSAGAVQTFASANVDGHSLDPAGHKMLFVANGSGASINVTIPTPGTRDGLAIDDRTVAVAAGATKLIPVDAGDYVQSDDSVWVNFSAVTTVTVSLLDIP